MSHSGMLEKIKAQGYDVAVLDLDRLDHVSTFEPFGELMEKKRRKEHSYRKWKHRKPRKRLFIDEYHLIMDKPILRSGMGMTHALLLPENLNDTSVLITDPKNDKI
ncbi:hypothetical protein A5881_004014 [Enterococcus termitis]|nr:hypothetical protein A5881_003878 [Enterococcus termitis]